MKITEEQLEALRRMTFPMSVAVANPALLANMQDIEEKITKLRAFGIVSPEQIERLFEKIGYNRQMPEQWTLDNYNYERGLVESFYNAVASGKDIDGVIDAIRVGQKELIWRNGRPWIDVP